MVTNRAVEGLIGVQTLNHPLQVTIHNVMHRLWTNLND